MSIDALGAPATAASSLRCLRPRGLDVQVGLLIGPDATPPLPMNLVIALEPEIYGSHGMAARGITRRCWPRWGGLPRCGPNCCSAR